MTSKVIRLLAITIASATPVTTTLAASLSELPQDKQKIIKQICLPKQFSEGATGYRQCVQAQIARGLSNPRNESLIKVAARKDNKNAEYSALSFDEKYAVRKTCETKGATGSSAYNFCVEEELKSIRGQTAPNLTEFSDDEQYVLRQTCFDIQESVGVAIYRRCIFNAVSNLRLAPKTDLSNFNTEEQSRVRANCQPGQTYGQPNEYRYCITKQAQALKGNVATITPSDSADIPVRVTTQNDIMARSTSIEAATSTLTQGTGESETNLKPTRVISRPQTSPSSAPNSSEPSVVDTEKTTAPTQSQENFPAQPQSSERSSAELNNQESASNSGAALDDLQTTPPWLAWLPAALKPKAMELLKMVSGENIGRLGFIAIPIALLILLIPAMRKRTGSEKTRNETHDDHPAVDPIRENESDFRKPQFEQTGSKQAENHTAQAQNDITGSSKTRDNPEALNGSHADKKMNGVDDSDPYAHTFADENWEFDQTMATPVEEELTNRNHITLPDIDGNAPQPHTEKPQGTNVESPREGAKIESFADTDKSDVDMKTSHTEPASPLTSQTKTTTFDSSHISTDTSEGNAGTIEPETQWQGNADEVDFAQNNSSENPDARNKSLEQKERSEHPAGMDFGEWLSQLKNSDKRRYCTEFLLYWLSFGENNYDSPLKAEYESTGTVDDHERVKKAVLCNNPQSLSDTLFYINKTFTQEQKEQTLNLLLSVLVKPSGITAVQNTFIRFFSDFIGLGNDQLADKFFSYYGQELPPMPRPDRLLWWDKQKPNPIKSQSDSDYVDALSVLGLNENASPQEIKLAYEQAKKRHKPSLFSSLGEKEQSLAGRHFEKYHTAMSAIAELEA